MNKQKQCSLHFTTMTCIKSDFSTNECTFGKKKKMKLMYKIDNTKVDN